MKQLFMNDDILNYSHYRYEGHVLLIVNVASKCGLTATNYKELNELHDQFAESKGGCNFS